MNNQEYHLTPLLKELVETVRNIAAEGQDVNFKNLSERNPHHAVYRQLIGHPATTARAATLNLPPTDVRAVQKGTLIPKSSPAVTLVTPL